MQKWFAIVLAVVAITFAGCRTTSKTAPIAPTSFSRIANPDTNTIALQLAIRKFTPAQGHGPSIWLVSAMHVGEPQYYSALQTFLDEQTVVLFEGINAEAHPRHVPKIKELSLRNQGRASPVWPVELHPNRTPAKSSEASFSMQASLAKALGLVFQLDAIQYNRANFLNSDLSVGEIQRLMSGPVALEKPQPARAAVTTQPAAPARENPAFDALLQVMDGTSFLGSLFKFGIQFIGANPRLQALAKISLIEAIGDLKGDFSTMRGMPPELNQLVQVLIQARNQHVIDDVKTELQMLPRDGSLAIFYGSGHMADMQKRLANELHYQYAEERWFTVFSVDCQKANVSPAEVQFTRNLIKSQLRDLQ